MTWLTDALFISLALGLVVLNGFFVAAEFALVKVRVSQLDELVRRRKPFAKTAKWLGKRLDSSLSACQLGITMASLALGWVGEPAFAHLLEPVFHWFGIESPALIHSFAFVIAFSLITALHLVIGEQAPKIFAIRRPEVMVLWCAAPMKFFYVVSYPFVTILNWATTVVLRWVGMEGSSSEHDTPHTEAEIRTLLREAHVSGNLTRSEHRLLNAVFEFDDMICRRVMVPRSDVEFIDVNRPLPEILQCVQRSKHTRYPVCDGSMDNVLGVLHIKDLVGISDESQFDLRSILRPPKLVPEAMLISKLLKHFQATHQLMAFVADEHGMVVGVVTLENVLEEIVGAVEDEFDTEPPEIVPQSPSEFIVRGGISLERVMREFQLDLEEELQLYPDIDTLSGLLVATLGRIVSVGDRVALGSATAEVMEVKGARAIRVKVTLANPDPTADEVQVNASAPTRIGLSQDRPQRF